MIYRYSLAWLDGFFYFLSFWIVWSPPVVFRMVPFLLRGSTVAVPTGYGEVGVKGRWVPRLYVISVSSFRYNGGPFSVRVPMATRVGAGEWGCAWMGPYGHSLDN